MACHREKGRAVVGRGRGGPSLDGEGAVRRRSGAFSLSVGSFFAGYKAWSARALLLFSRLCSEQLSALGRSVCRCFFQFAEMKSVRILCICLLTVSAVIGNEKCKKANE